MAEQDSKKSGASSSSSFKKQLEENWLLLAAMLGIFAFFWNRTDRIEDNLASKDYVNGEFKTLKAEMNGEFRLLNQRLDFMGVPKAQEKPSSPPTSTDSGSSTPPTATDGQSKP